MTSRPLDTATFPDTPNASERPNIQVPQVNHSNGYHYWSRASRNSSYSFSSIGPLLELTTDRHLCHHHSYQNSSRPSDRQILGVQYIKRDGLASVRLCNNSFPQKCPGNKGSHWCQWKCLTTEANLLNQYICSTNWENKVFSTIWQRLYKDLEFFRPCKTHHDKDPHSGKNAIRMDTISGYFFQQKESILRWHGEDQCGS